MHATPLALVLVLLAPASADPILVGVVPDLPGPGPGDEAVAIADSEGTALDLSGLVLDDGEGAWPIPDGAVLAAGQTAWFTGNASAWAAHDAPAPEAVWPGDPRFRLANDGDGLMLRDADGRVLDAFAWGDGEAEGVKGAVSSRSAGLVYTRDRVEGQWVDTDRAEDWVTPVQHRVGRSDLDRPTWTANVTLYALPDAGFEVLTGLLADARERIHLHVYDLRHAALVDHLVTARQERPVLDLQVLVEGRPVGQEPMHRSATAWALQRVEQAGGEAWTAGNGRYAFHHLKVLVVDDHVAVQSENWVPSGVPEHPSWGNRGWGAVVHDAAAADWFASWMAADRAAWDTDRFRLEGFDPTHEPPPRFPAGRGTYGPTVAPLRLEGVRVTPSISPDHTGDPRTDPVARLVATAQERVLVQQLDLTPGAANDLGWSGPDPLMAGLVEAARGGARVDVQTAGPFRADDTGNAEARAWLRERAPVRSGVFDRPGLATLHNKGLVVDDAVVVGSMNGNHHSRSNNREAGLVLEDPRAAAYFADVFAADAAGLQVRDWAVVQDDLGIPTPWPTLFAIVLVGLAWRWRTTRSP